MQCVILAGGRGTRLGELTASLPKAMVDVNGRPFLEYEIDLLRSHGIVNIVLCVGHLADAIQRHFGDGSQHGVTIRYSIERGALLGTAGAVKQAEPLLNEVFFLTYADSYLRMNYQAALGRFRGGGEPAMMVVLQNENRFERSNLVVKDGYVLVYDKLHGHPGMNYINFGVCLLRREALARIPPNEAYSQEQWFQQFIDEGRLAAFETGDRFYEIGSPDGLEEFRRLVAAGELP